jgi:hypothetical protein
MQRNQANFAPWLPGEARTCLDRRQQRCSPLSAEPPFKVQHLETKNGRASALKHTGELCRVLVSDQEWWRKRGKGRNVQLCHVPVWVRMAAQAHLSTLGSCVVSLFRTRNGGASAGMDAMCSFATCRFGFKNGRASASKHAWTISAMLRFWTKKWSRKRT